MHLTLKFLGETPKDQVPFIERIIKEIAKKHSSFELGTEKLGAFPSKERPRVIFLELRDEKGALPSLFQDLEEKLTVLGFKKEERAFHPHLTFGRMRSHKGKEGLKNIWEKEKLKSNFPVKKIIFFQSRLNPQGAIHEVLTEADFRE